MHARIQTLALTAFATLLLAGCHATPLPDACYLKPESGRCKASITRWYYEEKWGECRAFIWGGCGGVAPFESAEQCQSVCRVAPAADAAAAPAAKQKAE